MRICKSQFQAWAGMWASLALMGALGAASLSAQDDTPPADPVPPPPAETAPPPQPQDPPPGDDAVAPTTPSPTIIPPRTYVPPPSPLPAPTPPAPANEPVPGAPPPEAPSAVPDNPYQAISRRNPFGLLPPPPPVKEDATPPPAPPPPVNVRLSGFTDLMGRKKAFLVLTEQGPNKQPKSKALYEGERESGVEVLTIDFKSRAVKVNNNGLVTNLTFAKLEASSLPPQPMGGPGQQPGQHRVLPNMQGGVTPGGQQPPANPLSASTDAGGSVIVGGSAGGDEGAISPNRRGGVFVSGGNTAATGGNATGSSYNSGTVYNPTTGGAASGTPGVNTSTATPARTPRTGTPRYTPPIPPPLPDPRGGR